MWCCYMSAAKWEWPRSMRPRRSCCRSRGCLPGSRWCEISRDKNSAFHRHHAELVHERAIAVGPGIGRGEQLRSVEDRVGAGKEAKRLRLLAHVLAAGGQ